MALLAETHRRAGQAAVGLKLLADALDRVERGGGRWIEADLHRLRGALLLALPEPNEAEAEVRFHQAIRVARDQSARVLGVARCNEPCRLWRCQDRCDEASHLLAPVYSWFTEGLETPDLQEAKALRDPVVADH